MSQHIHHAFGQELAAMRQAQYEAEARNSGLVRRLKRARRVQFALAARSADAPDTGYTAPSPALSTRPARVGCAADLG